MWETFKILLLCLISVFIASLTYSWILICVVLLVLVVFLYDFDSTVGVESHAISKFKSLHLKVRNLYAAVVHRKPINNSFQFTPTMNSVNKQSTSFDLSRFNKSGNPLSPISNSASRRDYTSRGAIQSRQTSTPLTRTPPWQKNSVSPVINRTPILHNSISSRSPRYSLASLSPKSVNNESPSKPTIQTVTGPLLASTRFNVNLGTYTDSKSPGLTSRIVQYHNELSGNQTSTHQAKYGSPGVFPIVQLYKKELPILSRSPRRCTVRIAPPDPVSYNPDHANTILRDSFVQNNTENHQNDTEINTRSVLEALKEISRKRIHTNDDIDDISKRQRKNSVSSSSNSSVINLNKDGKRMREDTPPKPKESCTTPINSAPKRICVVNEIESSLSSSKLMRAQQGQKRKSTVNIPETNKQRRLSNGELISRETQTITTKPSESQETKETTQKTISTAAQTENTLNNGLLDIDTVLSRSRRKKKSNEIRTIKDIDEENSILPFAKISDTPKKQIFSEAPLEIMKQNKLSIMLSALGGQEPEIIPLPNTTLSSLKKKAQENPEGTDIIGKEVISILSPKNKAKHDKHVTFAVPNSDSIDAAQKSVVNSSTPSEITTPASIVSFSAPNTNFTSSQIQISSPPMFAPVATTSNNFQFGASSPNNNVASITTTTNSTNIITSSTVDKPENSVSPNFAPKPNFNFGVDNSSPAFGGLVPSSTTKTDVNKPTFQLPTNPVISTPSTSFGPVSTSAGFSSISQPVINFGTKPTSTTTSVTTSSTNFAPINTQAVSSLPTNSGFPISTTASSGLFNFSSKPDVKSTTSTFSFGNQVPPTQSPPKTGGFKFDLGNKSASKPEPPKTTLFGPSNVNKSFAFGTPATTTTTSNSNLTTTTNSAPVFGVQTTTSASTFGTTDNKIIGGRMFGTPTTTVGTGMFGTPSTTSATGVFGTATTTSGVAFGTATTTSGTTFGTGSITSGTAFGTATTTSGVGFGTANTTSGATFGTASTTSGATFGTASITSGTAFGTASTTSGSTFGTPTTTAGVFGTTNNTAPNGIFGNAPSTTFGPAKTTENPPNFGSFGANSAQNKGFGTGTQNSPAFGFSATKPQNNTFGGNPPTTTSSNFSFGSNTTTKTFAFGSTTTTTTAPPMFGATTSTPATNLFGGNASSGFGGATGTTNSFGTTTTTAQNSFGQQSTGVFGTASSNFGSGNPPPAFGANNNTFGTANASGVFGTTTQQPSTFGAGNSSQGNVFGMASGNNNNNQPPNIFGAASTNNNNTNNNAFGANQSTSFGGGFSNNNAPQSSGVGNFGSSAAQGPSPSAGVFTFGGAAPSSTAATGSSNAFQFGPAAQNPKQSGFNFSANTNTPNINFGSGAPPPFNATPAPAFGNTVPGQFNASAPATGMFNIGSGSTAPKQRPMIKARRRN